MQRPYRLFLNQFFGLKYDLYFVKSSLPTSRPPDQNRTSPVTNETVEAVILILFSKSRKGIRGSIKKNGIHAMINIIPTRNLQFLFFIRQI